MESEKEEKKKQPNSMESERGEKTNQISMESERGEKPKPISEVYLYVL